MVIRGSDVISSNGVNTGGLVCGRMSSKGKAEGCWDGENMIIIINNYTLYISMNYKNKF